MGTHNHLTALSPESFLEIIAVDPTIPELALPTGHRRWFGLDDTARQRRLATAPELTTWVVATDDLDAALGVARAAGVEPGEPVALTRGDLHWRLALRADGSLAYDGVFPILIQWPQEVKPVSRMQDLGIRLDALSLTHPEALRISAALRALGIDQLASLSVGDVALRAELHAGRRSFLI
jgi:hypothetical protein